MVKLSVRQVPIEMEIDPVDMLRWKFVPPVNDLKEMATLHVQIELLRVLYGVVLEPLAVCPSCRWSIPPHQAMKDFDAGEQIPSTIQCSNCQKHYPPFFVCAEAENNAVHFYSRAAVLSELRKIGIRAPQEVQAQSLALHHSALLHFHSFRQAYAGIGRVYTYRECENARTVIAGYFGQIPDRLIAECAGIPSVLVSRMHQQSKKPQCPKDWYGRPFSRVAETA